MIDQGKGSHPEGGRRRRGSVGFLTEPSFTTKYRIKYNYLRLDYLLTYTDKGRRGYLPLLTLSSGC